MTKTKSPVLPIIGGLVAMLCVGVIYLWSVLKNATMGYFGWESGSVNLIASIMLFAFCVGNFGGGALNDKIGPKKVSFVGVALFGVGIFLASCVKPGASIWFFYLTYSVIGGIGVGISYGALLSCIQKWFPHRRGFATGIATAAFGLGTVAFSPIIGTMLNSMTVSATLRTLSLVFLVVGLIACCFIQLPSEEYLAKLPKPAPKKNAIVAKREIPLKEAIRTVPFWCILLTIFFYNATWNMLNPIIRPLGENRGLSEALALTCVSLTGVFNEVTGENREPFVMGGGTYARKLPHALAFGLGGMNRPETTLFAPGHGGAHQPDEGLYLPNLKKALLIFALGLIEADRVLE